ncbi:MAG: PAS domain-containing protein [Deltaproteobacteria bacterium]|nr:PAS domain-containing protein [Deltaproteobacteria bacterium]
MKLRIILVVLSLLAFLSVSVAGYLSYSYLRMSAFEEEEKEIALQAERVRNSLSSFLSENRKTVRTLAGLEELRRALSDPDPASLAAADGILDHFRSALKADVCYLMDRSGTTVASSNRGAPDSFVGRNFAFRPYWRRAIRGTASTYMALGVTSLVRGVYSSHPVRGRGGEEPIGAAVIKAPIERIEGEFRRAYQGIVLLVDPHGIVFVSNRKEWLYRSLRRLSPEEALEVAASRQFGPGPWGWIGLEFREGKAATDGEGREYLAFRKGVDAYPGWEVIYLRDRAEISRKISGPLVRAAGSIVLPLCFLVGLAVFFLYRRASEDIVRRKAAEEALREAEAELARYSRDLERQVRDRTREIASILRYTPAVVSIKDVDGRYTFVNSRYEDLFGIRDAEVRGKTDYDIFPAEIADRLRENDRAVIAENRPRQVEERVPRKDGVRVYLSTKFPLYEEGESPVAVCGISIDITEIRKAQDQMRRLSDSIIAGQEKERAAVSRELHDELGQLLTALRLDASWLRDRLANGDGSAAARAREMCDLIDRAIDEVRGMATRLRPGVLDRLGLVAALEWFVGDFGKRTGIACRFRHAGAPRVGDRVATAAYRIAQESLTNAARHASAARVDVSLRVEDGRMVLDVEDDGRGFAADELPESRGLGLAGMRERAALIGGALTVRSAPGGGTRIRLEIPLPGAEAEVPA